MRKPLHKHIAHHAKRFSGHFTKYLYERDTIFATAWVFIFILMIQFLPLPNVHFLDAVKLALEDFDFNDIAYSKLKETDKSLFDKRIVIINIGHMDRAGIAFMLDKTDSMGPKVIGLDSYFLGPKEGPDAAKDTILRSVLKKTKNLVVISRINWEDEKDSLAFHKDYFDDAYSQRGYANFISSEKGEEVGTIRLFTPFEKDHSGNAYPSFAAALVKDYDPEAFARLQKRNVGIEVINYSRRISQYQLIDGQDLLDGNVDASAIHGKIALLGYVNNDKDDIEDKDFTPMNEKFAGKSIPDMNGIAIHANIISMVLDHNYINKLPSWVNWLVAIFIGWLHMSFFIRYFLENHVWFHLVARIAELISAFIFVLIGMVLFSRYRIRLETNITLIVIVLSVDIIYFYEAFAVWMHKKWGYRTVFHKQHH